MMPRTRRDDLPPELMKMIVRYEPETGEFFWKVSPQRHIPAGAPAGSKKKGHVMLPIIGRSFCAHRVAWALMTGAWPDGEIDHINRDPHDNRWINLRVATRSQNNANRRASAPHGFKGCTYNQRQGKWRARMKKNGREIHLGTFATGEEAEAAYEHAMREVHGAFACNAKT